MGVAHQGRSVVRTLLQKALLDFYLLVLLGPDLLHMRNAEIPPVEVRGVRLDVVEIHVLLKFLHENLLLLLLAIFEVPLKCASLDPGVLKGN